MAEPPPLPHRQTLPDLNPWDTGSYVADLQELLCAHGFTLRIDGDFGWRTEAAVRAFQRQHGLRIDSIVGQKTWNVLINTVKPGARSLREGHFGPDVRELQGLLQIHGYLIRRDSVFGPVTKEAVIRFQRLHHLRDDGVVCPVTWTLLRAGRPLEKTDTTSPRWLINLRKWW